MGATGSPDDAKRFAAEAAADAVAATAAAAAAPAACGRARDAYLDLDEDEDDWGDPGCFVGGGVKWTGNAEDDDDVGDIEVLVELIIPDDKDALDAVEVMVGVPVAVVIAVAGSGQIGATS